MLRDTSTAGSVRFAFTDRHGGVSAAPYDELNLGGHVGDDPAAVRRNRELLAAAIGLAPGAVSYMNQVHGNAVAVVEGPWAGPAPEVDALVTTQPGRALAVLVADCVPVLLADPDAGVIAVAHAGRPGLAAGVVPAAISAMRDLGARKLVARVGPAVCGRCYEVPEAMRAEVAAVVPEAWAVTRQGTPALDVPAGVVAQLRAAGTTVETVATCTFEDPHSYSYRRDGVTGRFAGLAWMSQA
ncbi:peptidoglycan editing factor PgeF [Jiangella rhizosphaerae]|uniref:Purine nucleoside phosphorylase n=1 Tax=Jiangella rhizosphaerae TaxID=2293569 RepID=A0A418KIB6_9ACTN|nr:peptidoglycan editing factor PgeF [Jiangella rhizosphaerae]RIQ12927.1 peptidoglycan editing factor PgeF [Jiangella rhizosphaerae]